MSASKSQAYHTASLKVRARKLIAAGTVLALITWFVGAILSMTVTPSAAIIIPLGLIVSGIVLIIGCKISYDERVLRTSF